MKKFLSIIFLSCLTGTSLGLYHNHLEEVSHYRSPQELQNSSMAVLCTDGNRGSCVLFTRMIKPNSLSNDMIRVTFGITANHIHESGGQIYAVEDENSIFEAQVLFESPKEACDVTIFMLKPEHSIPSRIEFDLSESQLPLGCELCTVGSPFGIYGHKSYNVGVLSYSNREADGLLYDQISVVGFPGSSGAGVFTKEGLYVGLFDRSRTETCNLMVPVRRIVKLLREKKMDWLIDESKPAPTLLELVNMKVVK